MSLRNEHLVWIDLEMTGLNPERDRIIESATLITDRELEILAEGPVFAVRQPESALAAMDEWNQSVHTKTGLVDRVRASSISESDAEKLTLEFIKEHVAPKSSPLCGNSICQDRRFLYRYMPQIENYLHYRNLDDSTVKELDKFWRPDVLDGIRKQSTHRALDDIRESIEELRYYRMHLIVSAP